MITIIENYHKSTKKEVCECVERKWIWHPDTLCDLIAEEFVIQYSHYTKEKYWYIPNHWVDKILLSWWKTEVYFWGYNVIKPIKCYLFGKVTQKINNEDIPIFSLFKESVFKVFKTIFSNKDILNYIDLIIDVNDWIWAGRPKQWYQPINSNDVKNSNLKLKSNDSVICSSYSPLSDIEKTTIFLENYINSYIFKQIFPFTWYDVKVIINRKEKYIDITMCIPFLSKFTPSKDFYYLEKDNIKKHLITEIYNFLNSNNIKLNLNDIFINNRDEWDIVYMVPFWSALDTWDYWVVWRWNKYNWVISIVRESNIEAFSGKNPIYHWGKIYNYISKKISDEIFEKFWYENYINIIAKVWDDLDKPHEIIIKIVDNVHNEKEIEEIVRDNLKNINNIHYWLLNYDPILNFNPILNEKN